MYNYQINKITREMQMDSTIPEKYKQNFDVSKEGHCIFQVVESICISLVPLLLPTLALQTIRINKISPHS
jgi:hypothetical protein